MKFCQISCIAILNYHHRFLIRLKLGLWHDQFRTLIFFHLNYFRLALAVSLGSGEIATKVEFPGRFHKILLKHLALHGAVYCFFYGDKLNWPRHKDMLPKLQRSSPMLASENVVCWMVSYANSLLHNVLNFGQIFFFWPH